MRCNLQKKKSCKAMHKRERGRWVFYLFFLQGMKIEPRNSHTHFDSYAHFTGFGFYCCFITFKYRHTGSHVTLRSPSCYFFFFTLPLCAYFSYFLNDLHGKFLFFKGFSANLYLVLVYLSSYHFCATNNA